MKEINFKNIKENRKNVFIDVRSPKEFNKETIPGALNIPIFDDKERELIGTIYKNESIEKAKEKGIEIASKSLLDIYKKIQQLYLQNNYIYLFCSRGGFRSSSLVSFLQCLNINVTKIHDGYKGYRAFIRENLPEIVKNINFVVLYGYTGTGKTHILKSLKEKGFDTLDLEGAANHRGSILGSVGLGESNSQKMFESLIYKQLLAKSSNLVFVEGESRRVGKSLIPDYLFDKMKEGVSIRISAPLEKRTQIILEDYIQRDNKDIIEALNHMRNRLGNSKVDYFIDLVKNKDYKPVIRDLFENYYDPLYKKHKHNYSTAFENLNSSDTAEYIISWIKDKKMEL